MTKYFLGIDVGKYHHQAILCNQEGEILEKPLRFANSYSGYQQLSKYLEKRINNSGFKDVQSGMEATGPYWLSLYEYLSRIGIQTVVLNPLQVRAYRNEGIRGSKTDRIDAALIAKILRFGEFSPSGVPNEDDLALRQLTRLRSNFVKTAAGLKKKVISIHNQVFPEYKTLFTDLFSAASRKLLQEAMLPEQFINLSTKKLTRILIKASRGRAGKPKAVKIQQAAKQSIGTTLAADAFCLSLKILLDQINHLEEQIKKLDREINKLFDKQPNTLLTIPGVGKVTAATIKAEIGDFSRFAGDKDGAEKLVALAGLDPKLKTSGKYKGKVRMSKRGSSYLRNAVRQAAFVAVCVCKDPMFTNIYNKQVNKGKHFEVAISHVGNKLLHVVYSLLKSDKKYEPHINEKLKKEGELKTKFVTQNLGVDLT